MILVILGILAILVILYLQVSHECGYWEKKPICTTRKVSVCTTSVWID